MALSEQMKEQIELLLKQNPLVLFMKGTKLSPRCGFSASVVDILNQYGCDYQTVNVLEDPALREAIKEFGDWPTIPQLYYQGQLIGGSDIVRTLHEQGELTKLLGISVQSPLLTTVDRKMDFRKQSPPHITLTPLAKEQFQKALDQAGPGFAIRLQIKDRGLIHELAIEVNRVQESRYGQDVIVYSQEIPFLIDVPSLALAHGISISFVTSGTESGFEIENPNAPAKVKQMTVRELKQKLDAHENVKLYDVRTEAERKIAQIPGAIWLTEEERYNIEQLPKDTPLLFHCHHGGRSQAAAEFYLQKGFRNVWNLQGGIDAWSIEIDQKVKRY